MKKIVDGDIITAEELEAMDKDQLLALAKANYIRTFTVNPTRLRKMILEVWNSRLHKGDAFRNI